MNGQLAVQDRKKRIILPASGLLLHTVVRPSVEYTTQAKPASALTESRFGQDFSRVAVQAASDTARSEFIPPCPLTPTRCPFGGACHTCPVQVQAKLAINQPGDRYEQEADQVAEMVMRVRESREEGQEEYRAPCCTQTMQRQAMNTGTLDDVPPIVREVLHSPSQPLDVDTRAFMEPRFGRDFSGVRVHTDEKAGEAAQAVNALAYTVGREIVFGKGQYAPKTTPGRRLLAHELTHIIQQHSISNTVFSSSDQRNSNSRQLHGRQTDRTADQTISGQSNDPLCSTVFTGSLLLQRAVDYDECTSAEETVVLDSHNRAMNMITNAVTKLGTYNATTPADVKTALDTHFHSSGTTLAAWIAFNLNWLKGESDSPTYECEKPQIGTRLGWSMWCVPWTDIELYPLWFAESDIDKRARTMIHEWVHRYGCNFDLGYEWEQGYSGHGTLRSLLNADPWAHFVYDVR